jgi:hypothetical protein
MATQTLMMQVFKRLKAEGRWDEAEPHRNELATRARDLRLKGIDAQNYTYTELAKKYPPLDGSKPETAIGEEPANSKPADKRDEQQRKEGDAARFSTSVDVAPFPSEDVAPFSKSGDLSVSGLSKIPANWGDLPSNAPLSAEVSWVQANRLRVVRETADGVVVDLSRSLSPAPSYAALGWLETSIKTYAKFVDVAAKATASQDGEAAEVRRELQSIEEVRRLLASMLEG